VKLYLSEVEFQWGTELAFSTPVYYKKKKIYPKFGYRKPNSESFFKKKKNKCELLKERSNHI